jgi:hypothetical protein
MNKMNKELLEEVFEFTSGNVQIKEIAMKYNDFELSYKCKEYALRKGYSLISQSRGYCKDKGICFIYKDDWTSEFDNYCLETFSCESEIEAIFESAEWIRTRN